MDSCATWDEINNLPEPGFMEKEARWEGEGTLGGPEICERIEGKKAPKTSPSDGLDGTKENRGTQKGGG